MARAFPDGPPGGRTRVLPAAARNWLLTGSVALLMAGATAGCRHEAPKAAPAKPPVIPVGKAVSRVISDYVYYTGRTDAVQSVNVRARVSGYLTKMPFKEGAEVKEGDILFEIDPRPYQAQYDASKAQVELREANAKLTQSENLRSRAISRNSNGAISQESLEQSQSQEAQAVAQLNLAKANLNLAKLELDFTKVPSPINGHVSRYFLTIGNLVTQDQTLLTTVVSVDPMYAFFDVDERTVLRVRKAINEGKITPHKDTNEIPVNMGLEGEDGYPHHGNLNFVNNTVNLTTGTITLRGVFANPLPPKGRRLITPGMFVRIQLPIGEPHPSLLIAERALGSDQGVKFLYVVDAKNTIQYRRVKTGEVQEDGLIPIDEGLKADEWVVIGGLPQIKPRMVIEPESTPMQASDGAEDGEKGPTLSPSKPAGPAATATKAKGEG